MGSIMESILDAADIFVAWASDSLKQTTQSYCDLQTADSETCLVGHDGSLVSVLKIDGVQALIGPEEFDHIQEELAKSLNTVMSRPGVKIQVHFNYSKQMIIEEIAETFKPAKETADEIGLSLDDLFKEKLTHLSDYCAHEEVYFVIWTLPASLTKEQLKRANKAKQKLIKSKKVPPFNRTQNIIAAIPDIRDGHDSLVTSLLEDLNAMGMTARLLEVHEAVNKIRRSADIEFTDRDWRPMLPGDKITIREPMKITGEISDITWPSLAQQILPRDAEIVDLKTAKVGDRIYSNIYIDLFPKDIQPFSRLFARVLNNRLPWRISFLMESNGLSSTGIKAAVAAVLSFSSSENRLISDSINLLKYINLNSDDTAVKLRVAISTWSESNNLRELRSRAAQLAKAVEGWGTCDVSEISGDPFAGAVSTMLGVANTSVAVPTIAPLTDALYLLPLYRPASPWNHGALLLRSPDGRLWPYQPGSPEQTTWIDLVYARPGSGKSVLSNAINLALCLLGGLKRLPRIAIIDIGPSSSGLISLLKEALPLSERHKVAYHRLQMTPKYAINPFDTQLGCRKPTAQDRGFLVNLMTLLATPIGADRPYDGISDMAGMVVDELYKELGDKGNPHVFTPGVEEIVDGILEEIEFVQDARTTWWEVTDALFMAGFVHEATLAQRHAVPVLSDAASMCRSTAVQDLYGKITAPTGESLIDAFARMISGAVREYPILGEITQFDIGDSRIVSLDLDEVAKSGGEAANRQTSVMYMLARYILARDFYLNQDNVKDFPEQYQQFHEKRVAEIREDPKRLVMDEFHRTANSHAVRAQVITDMREGRKWKVQIALLSQSLDDFDSVMVEFGTSIFIMDAGPEASIQKTTKTFGLSETAQVALRTRVHGPRAGGGTFLAQFATKHGMNTQLLTLTLGPIELWAFSTTADDAIIRNALYAKLGPATARQLLAQLFPSGTATKALDDRKLKLKEQGGVIDSDAKQSVAEALIRDILDAYSKDPNVRHL